VKVLNEKRENIKFLPGITLPKTIQFTAELEEALRGAVFVVLAVPSKYMRSVLERMKGISLGGMIIVSVTKGIEQKTRIGI
jgi:glycerol-3-phosphate dehydrogenase (NAD(P)+)